jgi:hypothetical protein
VLRKSGRTGRAGTAPACQLATYGVPIAVRDT